jgi:NTP pyrophosphatase (non-canonical NTP hydrolase)
MGYFRSGKAVYYKNDLNIDILIADCDDEEKAHFILNRIQTHSSNFIRDALVTCSPEFHGDMVSWNEFKGRLNGAIDALNKLDQVKKTLFYGRDNNLIAEGQRDASSVIENFGGTDNAFVGSIAANIIHGALGFATEAGELLEALKAAINGNQFDWINVQEELGDAAWYAAILADAGDFEFEDYEQRIIAKLRARYPDKFNADNANNRNLEAERAILEDRNEPLSETRSPEGSDTATLVSTPPASGPEAVKAVEAAADTAFAAVKGTKADAIDAPVTQGTKEPSELSKSPAARLNPLPDEHLAHQPIREEDKE